MIKQNTIFALTFVFQLKSSRCLVIDLMIPKRTHVYEGYKE